MKQALTWSGDFERAADVYIYIRHDIVDKRF